MFKLLLIVLIVGGAFAYSKFGPSIPNVALPQMPQNLSEAGDLVNKYFPNAASQSAVLGAKVQNESVILLIEAAKKLKPDEFKTLQQFICEPHSKKE